MPNTTKLNNYPLNYYQFQPFNLKPAPAHVNFPSINNPKPPIQVIDTKPPVNNEYLRLAYESKRSNTLGIIAVSVLVTIAACFAFQSLTQQPTDSALVETIHDLRQEIVDLKNQAGSVDRSLIGQDGDFIFRFLASHSTIRKILFFVAIWYFLPKRARYVQPPTS